MSTSPAKKFGLKRASELRNVAEFSKEEMESIKLTKCESSNLENQNSEGCNLNNTQIGVSNDDYFDNKDENK